MGLHPQRSSVLDDEILATIILKSKRDGVDDINLYEPGTYSLFPFLAHSIGGCCAPVERSMFLLVRQDHSTLNSDH